MRLLSFFALSLTAMLPCFAQTAANPGPGLPKEPREVFAAAAPFYDFSDPTLKPWHLKATYQLYDEKGKPSEQGTYEYWWASPKVYRSSWTRPGVTHTDWHMANGKSAHQETGTSLKFFEYKLQDSLLSPLPPLGELEPAKVRLDKEYIGPKNAKNLCIMVTPVMPLYKELKSVPLGLFPTYCFDSQLPALRANRSFGTLTVGFNHIVKMQNRYLPREILFFEGERKILSAEVDSVTNLAPSDPALTPNVDASVGKLDKVNISAGVMVGRVLKKPSPYYPPDAKAAGISGTVVLRASIGRDGGIHDLQVISAPAPSLAISALWAVSQWEYKPYLLLGEPVAVETTVNVVFSLGG